MKSHLVTCVGINHLTSPVGERETLAFSRDELLPALQRLNAGNRGVVILSTCNRTELYTTAARHETDALVTALNAEKGASVDPAHFYAYQHRDAVQHLFRVAAGIESMVVGESQVLGQVRDAMSVATEAGALNGVLSRVFHSAIVVGKRARTETQIGRHAVSISSAAVALARKHADGLEGKTVLVISAGSAGKLAAHSIAENSGARILVANRTAERAAAVAAEIGGGAEAVAFSKLATVLPESDVVISGTGADGYVLGPELIAPAAARRNGNGLLLIDVAVPRDIDPSVRDIPGVSLFDIDDVETMAQVGLNGRLAEVGRVEAIIAEEVASFLDWWDTLDVLPVISALRERAEAIRLDELARTLKRLPDLDEGSRQRIEAMTAAIVKKMLDRPISRLKDGADKALYMEALQDLFDVPGKGPRGPSGSRGSHP
ncbi:MAG TPA: glutamyl-tRNA reductase [Dehalococcoidia bacterium]|nr:glutamyl-tRNA reductase [Dehalococcoidia bacterium]